MKQNLLAYYLVYEKALGLVGQLIFIKIGRAFRQAFYNALEQSVDAEFLLR